MYISEAGGCCDCGDIVSWREHGCCPVHRWVRWEWFSSGDGHCWLAWVKLAMSDGRPVQLPAVLHSCAEPHYTSSRATIQLPRWNGMHPGGFDQHCF